MKIIVAVNHVAEIGYRQTTALLIAALARKGHVVLLAGVVDFSIDTSFFGQTDSEAAYFVRGVTLPPMNDWRSKSVENFVRSNPPCGSSPIESGDLILIRSNPGRDIERAAIHSSFLDICRSANSNGIRVINDPVHLQFFASKASLASVDAEYCPPMLLSNRIDQVVEFVHRSGTDCVIKPLVGSRGHNVIRVSHDQTGLDGLIGETFVSDFVVAQHFVEADHLGDKRVVVVGGNVLEIDGHLAGIARRPAAGDFRANLHAGGTALRLALSPRERRTAEYAAKLLQEHGIWLAGVDLIGDKIIEFNVFSTGGLFDAENFSGISFSDEIVARLTRVASESGVA